MYIYVWNFLLKWPSCQEFAGKIQIINTTNPSAAKIGPLPHQIEL